MFMCILFSTELYLLDTLFLVAPYPLTTIVPAVPMVLPGRDKDLRSLSFDL